MSHILNALCYENVEAITLTLNTGRTITVRPSHPGYQAIQHIVLDRLAAGWLSDVAKDENFSDEKILHLIEHPEEIIAQQPDETQIDEVFLNREDLNFRQKNGRFVFMLNDMIIDLPPYIESVLQNVHDTAKSVNMTSLPDEVAPDVMFFKNACRNYNSNIRETLFRMYHMQLIELTSAGLIYVESITVGMSKAAKHPTAFTISPAGVDAALIRRGAAYFA